MCLNIKNKPDAQGFTLIELMVSLSLIAVLVTIGVPALSGLIRDIQQKAEFTELANAYAFARQEAVHRGEGVSLCPVSVANPQRCSDNWSDGLMIYINKDTVAKYQQNNGDQRLKVIFFSDQVSVNWNNGTSIKVKSSGAVSAAGTFNVTIANSTKSRRLIISPIGRARVEVDYN